MTTVNAPLDTNGNPSFGLTADLNIFTIRNGALHILLVKRRDEPFKDHWALPGGFCKPDEAIEDAALRELGEETNITNVAEIHVEQVKTYYTPNRDPRQPVVTVSFAAIAAKLPDPTAGDDAAEARWWMVDEVLGDEFELAFDHKQVITDALERVRAKLEYTTLATSFLDDTFSMAELHRVYTIVWGITPDLANFRRKVLSVEGFVEPVGKSTEKVAGPAPMLYRAGKTRTFSPALVRG